MKATKDGYQLSTGREICANCGYVGINSKLEVSDGYDGQFEGCFENIEQWNNDGYLTPLTEVEQDEVCDFMIELWTKRKNQPIKRNARE